MARHCYEDWGRLTEHGDIVLCPNPLGDTCNPTEAMRRAAGYKPIVLPARPEDLTVGGYWEIRYEDNGDSIGGTWWWCDDGTEPSVEQYDTAMELRLLAERNARGYTTREPTAYLSSSVPRYAQDAKDWMAHLDAVMVYATGVMNAYTKDGDGPSVEVFLAGMPKIEWTFREA